MWRIPCQAEAIFDELLVVGRVCERLTRRRAPHQEDDSIAALQSIGRVVPGWVVTHPRANKRVARVQAPHRGHVHQPSVSTWRHAVVEDEVEVDGVDPKRAAQFDRGVLDR